MGMRYVVATSKTIDQAAADLSQAVARHGFGVLHIHDLQQTLHKKGVELAHACRIFEVCNPHKAIEVLNADMGMNMALPCRISVYEEDGQTMIGTIRPTAMLGLLSDSVALQAAAEDVERASIAIIDEAAA
jgi:uncharacterized protein (DUF302 family)